MKHALLCLTAFVALAGLTVQAAPIYDTNLIGNGGFELDSDSNSIPDDWGTADFVAGSPVFSYIVDSTVAFSGNACVSIEITEASGGAVDWRQDLGNALEGYAADDELTMSFMYKTSGIDGGKNKTGFIARIRDSSGSQLVPCLRSSAGKTGIFSLCRR